MSRPIQLLLALLALLVAVQAKALETQEFAFVAREVARSESLVRREFAAIVLLHLSEVYLGEAGLARRQAEKVFVSGADRARLLNWASGVEREAEKYLRLHDAVHGDSSVKLGFTREAAARLMLSIDSVAVLANHPRPSQQVDLEAAIIADFCGRVDCLGLGEHVGGVPRLAPLE